MTVIDLFIATLSTSFHEQLMMNDDDDMMMMVMITDVNIYRWIANPSVISLWLIGIRFDFRLWGLVLVAYQNNVKFVNFKNLFQEIRFVKLKCSEAESFVSNSFKHL